ncbi:glycosyltransferase family protein [Halodesulfovibrio marinisediminis]|uniref:Predicted glycosyl transferase n=1 Tax=Halodesulfovibrio marinisediminis DSM 17456 TaxID=1121457 RepID=A0A1N6HBW8_9BACT|nr:glycosyltransferase [Halodesulfovibrio marinisediminis]SIO17282.1 Predicted glycosyl transferase [Halodesulfovibrio marinisediminis DSM 17456]
MRVVHYCQHVLGMGHFFRSLEIDKALAGHDVTLITGGTPVSISYPDHVQVVELPSLSMDEEFGTFIRKDTKGNKQVLTEQELESIKKQRTAILIETIKKLQPDIFLVELFPFGRKQFSFELMPVLELAKQHAFPNMQIVCSVRDILVEKTNQKKFEERVLNILNTYFDAVLVHTDPEVITLEATFPRINEIKIPVFNTGYITPLPHDINPEAVRKSLSIASDMPFILGSIGSGSVHPEIIENLAAASIQLNTSTPHALLISTGPFMQPEVQKRIRESCAPHPHITVTDFIPDFISYLSAADLSLSMAGYNTTMNLLAVNTFGLVHPFDQNREQRMRSTNLEQLGALKILEQDDMIPDNLSSMLNQYLNHPAPPPQHQVDLQGAAESVRILENL